MIVKPSINLSLSLALLAVLVTLPGARAGTPVNPNGHSHIPDMWGHYRGWGTYYGTPPMAPNSHVHCHLPNRDQTDKYGGVVRTIAINADQYAGSRACGMCVEVWGNGKMCEHGIQGPDCGLGPPGHHPPANHVFTPHKWLAVVTDELWERGHGDIDVGIWGDGKFPVEWKPVPCPWDRRNARIALHAGANPYYMKVQFRYLDSPVKWVQIESTGQMSQERFHDNHFVFRANGGSGVSGWHNGQLKFRAESTLGTHYCGSIDLHFRAAPYEYNAYPC